MPSSTSASPVRGSSMSMPRNSRPKASTLSQALGASKLRPLRGVFGSAFQPMTQQASPIGATTANSAGHGATARIAEANVGTVAEEIATEVALMPMARPSCAAG